MSTSTVNVVDEYDAVLGYHPTVIPLDIRLGISTSSAAANASPPLRWGILATGKVAHDYTQVLKFLSSQGHEIVAVGSRSMERADEFANLHRIPNRHATYDELCSDPSVDIVYVASLHPDHRVHAEMALRNGKHVLIEKPIAMKSSDAKALYDLGEELGLFVGEGMWTRFFPAVEWTRTHLGEEAPDGIGTVRVVQVDFSIDGDDVGPYPTDSLYASELGGGTSWTMGPYVVAAALMPFGREPDTIAANGIFAPDEDGVGELAVGMTLTFDTKSEESEKTEGSPPTGRSIASGLVSYLAESSEITMYAGKGGRITIDGPAHCPTSATLIRKVGGRGNGATSGSEDDAGTEAKKNITTVDFPLPPSKPEIEESGGIRMPNSMGFIYEAEAVRRLIAAGHHTFPQWTPEESVGCIRTIEKALEQIKELNS